MDFDAEFPEPARVRGLFPVETDDRRSSREKDLCGCLSRAREPDDEDPLARQLVAHGPAPGPRA
jgi:hypothetical protein